jgi:hypothetical protein
MPTSARLPDSKAGHFLTGRSKLGHLLTSNDKLSNLLLAQPRLLSEVVPNALLMTKE